MAVALLPSRYFGDVMDNVFFPVMARMREDRARLADTWLNLVSNCFVFMFGVGVFLAANGEAIVRLAFGERWLDSAPVFQLLCLGAGFGIVGRLGDSANRALGQVHDTARRKMITALLFIPSAWFGSRYGLIGVCTALVAVQAINALMQARLACFGMGINFVQATGALRLAGIGSSSAVVLNGITFWSWSYLDLPWALKLAISLLTNVALALALFWPLVRLYMARPSGTAQ
jgi:O-antigen/teichoic acid export membrane protein